MINKEMFTAQKGNQITLQPSAGLQVVGVVVDCSDKFLTLKIESSQRNMFIALEHIVSFYVSYP